MMTSFISTAKTNVEAYINQIPNFQEAIATSALNSCVLGSIYNMSLHEGFNCAATGALATTISALITPFFQSWSERNPNINQSLASLKWTIGYASSKLIASAELGKTASLRSIAIISSIMALACVCMESDEINKLNNTAISHSFLQVN